MSIEPATREFTNELGNRIRITIEGPSSTSENVLTVLEAVMLRGALESVLGAREARGASADKMKLTAALTAAWNLLEASGRRVEGNAVVAAYLMVSGRYDEPLVAAFDSSGLAVTGAEQVALVKALADELGRLDAAREIPTGEVCRAIAQDMYARKRAELHRAIDAMAGRRQP